MQNIAEISVELRRGRHRRCRPSAPTACKYTPFMLSIFFFVFFTNIFEVIPVIQMPATARIALPMFLALTVWFVFIDRRHRQEQGPIGYFKNSLFPPGVPPALLHPRGAHRVRLDLPGAAVQPHGPSLRQPAGRPHPAGHLRACSPSGLVVTKWYVVLPAAAGVRRDLLHRLRDPGRASCRPTCSPCSPACTSARRCSHEH